MRPLFLSLFAVGVFVLAGCLANSTREEYASAPGGSRAMYPLSTQTGGGPAVGAADPALYPDPAFDGGYSEMEDPYAGAGPISQPVYSTPMAGAPVMTYQQAPVAQRELPERHADGRPMTFAERRMARGSPYDPILRGTPYTYSTPAPTYVPQTQPVAAYSTAPVAVQPVQTYVPQTQPSVTYSPAPVTYQQTTMAAQYPGQVITTPGSTTVIRGGTVMLPDPPMVIRDQSGRIETVGLSSSTTVPLVRVPSQYAPGVSSAAVPAAPPIVPQIVATPATAVSAPVQSGGLYIAAPATYAAAALQLAPATDIPPGNHPNDVAPSQWYEIIRPDNGPIRIGRVSSTCVCVSVRVPNRFVPAGERALIEARTVSRPSVNGLTYGIYVAVLEPVSTTLEADIVVSTRR